MIKEKHQFSRLIPMTFIGLETDTKPTKSILFPDIDVLPLSEFTEVDASGDVVDVYVYDGENWNSKKNLLSVSLTDELEDEIADIKTETDKIPAEIIKTANILLDTAIKIAAAGSKTFGTGVTAYLSIDSGVNGADILAIVVKGVVGADWTLDIYVPAEDAVAAPAAGDLRDSIEYANTDTEGGLLSPFAIAFNAFLDFTNDSVGDDDIDQVQVVYRSRGTLTLAWEA